MTLQEILISLDYDCPNPKLGVNRFMGASTSNPSGYLLLKEVTTSANKTIQVAVFGDWKTGDKEYWETDGDYSAIELEEIRTLQKEAQEDATLQKEKGWEETKDECKRLWANYSKEGKSTYLKKKGLPDDQLYGMRIIKPNKLALPVMDFDKIWSFQYIQPNGRKQFLEHGKIKGNFYVIGELSDGPLYFAEGIATAISIHLAVQRPVIVCFNATNLRPVAEIFRGRFPSNQFFICADEDLWTSRGGVENPGRVSATEAAEKVGGMVLAPTFPPELLKKKPTDFNDLHILCGFDELKKQLETPIKQLETAKESKFISFYNLSRRPKVERKWLVKDLLKEVGVTNLIAKPKVGKSTLTRDLALALAQGEMFWGRETTQMGCLLFCFEEDIEDVRRHLETMGANPEVPIYIYALTSTQNVFLDIRAALLQWPDIGFVVIDTLFRVIKVKSGNEYSEMTAALEPFQNIAKELSLHIMITHHASKGTSKGIDSALGSTAIGGSGDHNIILEAEEGEGQTQRYVSTISRTGDNLEKTAINYDEKTGRSSLGKSKKHSYFVNKEKLIYKFLQENPGESFTTIDIGKKVKGRGEHISSAVRNLAQGGYALVSGSGGRGNAKKYAYNPQAPDMDAPTPF